jgi:hypothetical protein
MTDAKAIYDYFNQLSETGDRCWFRLKSGGTFEGWVLEVSADEVLVMWAPSPFYAQATGTDEMSPPDEWIQFADIELSSLNCQI